MTGTRGRILWLASNGPRWAGDDSAPFILALAGDLQALGWNIVLLLPHAPGIPLRARLREVEIERFRYAWPESLQALCYGAGVLANLRARPAKATLLPLLFAAQWRATRELLAREPFDLVHAHWLLPQGLSATLACGSAGPPLVVTAHGGDLFALRGGVSVAAKRRVLAGASAVTVNSSATERLALELGAVESKLRRIPMGATGSDSANPDSVSLLRARFRRERGPLLMFVGRLVPEKGVADLIGAVALMRESLPDVTALLVGAGPERGALEAQSRRLGIADRVFFAGAVAPDRVPDHLGAADIYVGASRRSPEGWVEAQGVSFVEAMRSGLVVVATDTGGISDVIRDGVTGLLVPEESPAAIAGAV